MRSVLAIKHTVIAMILASASPAIACTFTPIENPSGVSERGDNCSIRYPYASNASANLFEAKDMGAGFVSHGMMDGQICEAKENAAVVMDCNTGDAVVFGGDVGASWMAGVDENGNTVQPVREILLDKIKIEIENGSPLSVSEIETAAVELKVEYSLRVKTSSLIRFNERRFKLGCGCRLYYPDTEGGKS